MREHGACHARGSAARTFIVSRAGAAWRRPACALQSARAMSTWTLIRTDQRVELAGVLRVDDAARLWRTLRAHAARATTELAIDLGGVTAIDGAAMSLLVDLRASLHARGIACELRNVPEALRP